MVAALAGDGASYRMLLTALTRHLRGYFSRRLDPAAAEDAVQECLIAIHTHRATYDSAMPFTAWMYGIARYKLLDEFRRVKRPWMPPLKLRPGRAPTSLQARHNRDTGCESETRSQGFAPSPAAGRAIPGAA